MASYPELSDSKSALPTSVFLAIWSATNSLVLTWTKPNYLHKFLEIADLVVAGGPTKIILDGLYGALFLILNYIILKSYLKRSGFFIDPSIS